MKRLLLSSMIALSVLVVQAQQTVSGRIVDGETGEALIGASVTIKGTSTGTVTDIDGNYSLSVTDGATLVISYVGYVTQEIAVGSRTSIDVSLASDAEQLSELVVVGYGTQDKKEITSATVQLNEEEFNRGNINDASTLLQGKVPGLSVYNKGGNPNSNPTVRLRGISTLGANQSPLVVIDGVIGATLDNVDPNDIESINVLKDGSASAIYGSRGSSGVILVTTKGGKKGQVTASYNGYVSAANVARNIDVMTASEYTAAGGNDLGAETDWQDLVTRTAVSNVHNISVAGGSQNTTFRFSTNIRTIEGVLLKSGFDQINSRASIDHWALNDKLNVKFNMSLTNRESNFSFNEALRYAALFNPTAPVRNTAGGYFQAVLFDNFNPVAIVEQNQNLGKRKNLNFNTQASYELMEGLTLTANVAKQYTTNLTGQFYPQASLFRGFNRGGLASRYTSDEEFTLFEGYGSYTTDLNNINLTFTGGYSYQEIEFEDIYVEVGNFPTDATGFNVLEDGGDILTGSATGLNINSNVAPTNRIIAFFGRLNMTFDDGIFLNASIRREGSSWLGEDNQWGIFPAVGVGVDINKYANIDAFDALKFRAGYGVTGSLPERGGLSKEAFDYNFSGGGTVTRTREANPDLKWEEKAEINIGLDFVALNNKLSGTIDWYTRDVNDFILPRQAASSVFIEYANLGDVNTKGLEIAMNYAGIGNGEISWSPGIIFSTYKTVIQDYLQDESFIANLGAPGQNATPTTRVKVGEEIGQIWGPVFEGVETDGTVIFADVNGDGTVIADPTEVNNPDADMQLLGSGIPDFELGFTNTVTYKNWELNMLFRGAFGHSLLNTFRAFYEPIDPGAINSYNRVQTDLQIADLTEAKFSSLYVEKADFVRLDNVTLSYKFDMSGSNAFKSLSAYANVQNAFTLTNYTGIDPEPVLVDGGAVDNGGQPGGGGGVLAPGIDRRNNYFTARTFTVGIKVGF